MEPELYRDPYSPAAAAAAGLLCAAGGFMSGLDPGVRGRGSCEVLAQGPCERLR